MTADDPRLAEAMAKVLEAAKGLTGKDIRAVREADRHERVPFREAPPVACSSCPWRRENEGSDDPLLSEESLVHYWWGLREGKPFACHKTYLLDSELTGEDEQRGWCATSEQTTPRECAGALAQMLKEERLRDELGSDEVYMEVRGDRAMTSEGFARLGRRREIGAQPVRELADLDRYGRDWFPEPDGHRSRRVSPPCFCAVCTNHEKIHDQATLTLEGAAVSVDASLAELLEALRDTGAVTYASCENLRDAVERVLPAELERLGADPVNGHVVREGFAYIRGIASQAWVPVAEAVQALPSGQVLEAGRTIQVAFPLNAVSILTEAARNRRSKSGGGT